MHLTSPTISASPHRITDSVGTVLGELAAACHGPEAYLDTLAVLFDHQGNQTATARHLHRSVRAVTYRLERIRTLTGYHPSETRLTNSPCTPLSLVPDCTAAGTAP